MNAILSIGLFFVVAVIYIVITDVFTIYFRMTGMPEEKAKFQVISLLTNSGYTTKESEIVVGVLARRKVARAVMLFGYIFSVTVVSIFINAMLTLPAYEAHEVWPALAVMCVLFVGFLLVKRIPAVKERFGHMLENAARKKLYGKHENAIILLDEYQRGVLVKVILNKVPDALEGRTIKETGVGDGAGVHWVFVERENKLIQPPVADVVLQPGDTVAVFGPLEKIREVFYVNDDKLEISNV